MEVTYPSREAAVTDKFCGSSIPGTIISSSNSMVVKFVSDYSVTKKGFSAVWSKYGFNSVLLEEINNAEEILADRI